MALNLPSDFPPAVAAGLLKVKKVHAGSYFRVVNFINAYWGDLSALDKAIAIWQNEGEVSRASIARLNTGLAKLAGKDAEKYWSGIARDEYVNWRNDFNDKTLNVYHENMLKIKDELDAIHSNIWSIRGHIIAMVIEIIGVAVGIAASATVIGAAEAVLALIALVGTLIDYEWRVQGDLDEKGRHLESISVGGKFDRGGGTLSLPFKTHIIGDWSDWRK